MLSITQLVCTVVLNLLGALLINNDSVGLILDSILYNTALGVVLD